MSKKIYFGIVFSLVLLLVTSTFSLSTDFFANRYTSSNTTEIYSQRLSFSTAGVIDDVMTTGSYNFTIPEAGFYKLKVEITGSITVRVQVFFEHSVFSNYYDRYISGYDSIDVKNNVSPDSPYETILWFEHAGNGFLYITRTSGTSGTFSATVTPVKAVSDAATLTEGTHDMTISKDSGYIGNFSVTDHSRAYNLTAEQYIPALPLTTVIKQAWLQIERIDNVNASHPVNITFVEDGLFEHSIGQITKNVSDSDEPLKFYFNVAYLNFTENSATANVIKFNTTASDSVILYDASVMIEDADGDINTLHTFPLLFVFISDGAPYTTTFNLYDVFLSLNVGVSISVMNPKGFLGYDSIADLSLPVPSRKVRDWILNGYNVTPRYTGFILVPQNYTFAIKGSIVADSHIAIYLNEKSYSILSVNETLNIVYNKSEALGFGESHIVLLNLSNVSPDALYQIQPSFSGNNWTFVSLVAIQGTFVGEGPSISRVDRTGYSNHFTHTMKDIHFLPVTMYSATNVPMEKLHVTYFEERNDNGTYNSAMFQYRTTVYGPSRNTLLLFVMGFASNTALVNSSDTATLTLSFTQSGTVESASLNTMNKYTVDGNTTGFKVVKLETQPGYEYNITFAPNNTQGIAEMEMLSGEYKENALFSNLPQGTTTLGKSKSFEYTEIGFTSSPKYIVIYPKFNDTAVSLYIYETKYMEFPSSGTAELRMGMNTNISNYATLKFSTSPDEVYSIKITADPGFVGFVSIFYYSPDGKLPFKYTPFPISTLSIPGGNPEVVYEYVGRLSGSAFMTVYSSGSGIIHITITRRYLVPDFVPIPGLFLTAALPIALIAGVLLGRVAKRGKSEKASGVASKSLSKRKTKPRKKKK